MPTRNFQPRKAVALSDRMGYFYAMQTPSRKYRAAPFLGLLLLPLLSGCTGELNTLEQVIHSGELVVLTRNAGTTYYEGGNGLAGLEYILVKGFAEELGVEPHFVLVDNLNDLLSQLAEGKAPFAAAGLTITPPRQQWLKFTPPYQQVQQQLIYKLGSGRPRSLAEVDGLIEVVAGSSHSERLTRLHHRHNNLQWQENDQQGSDELLSRVASGELAYTIADSNEFSLQQRFMHELRVAFEIGKPDSLAWAFPKFQDDSLYLRAVDYFERLKASGELKKLLAFHYEHLEGFDYVGTRAFSRDIDKRLPEFQKLFEYAASETGIDWRLLAAIAYQESHWNPRAVSPTGVRGMMMLTKGTAKDLGVKKRSDPVESIRGGAYYFRKMLDKFPERVTEPDRTWFAVAAYNIGFGHIEDTRILTQRLGGNPDNWNDVKTNLPKLRQRKWYQQTKRGYARGNEALLYVETIRSYYDILVWKTEQERQRQELLRPKPSNALSIDGPAL